MVDAQGISGAEAIGQDLFFDLLIRSVGQRSVSNTI